MNAQLMFWIIFVVLLFCIIYCDLKYNMLRDTSTANNRPYSFSRVQLAWWSVIILTSFITIITGGNGIPTFTSSTLILLGISSATTATARLIDLSDEMDPKITRSQNENSDNFILDILSDAQGVSIHRFQVLIFNITFGVWFIISVLHNLSDPNLTPDYIMPVLEQNNLILVGLSSGIYATLKTTENKNQLVANK